MFSRLFSYVHQFKVASPPFGSILFLTLFILKTVSGDFCFGFFSWLIFPQAPEYNIRVISNFFKISRWYSHVKVHHRYQQHRWQIMGTITYCLLLKVNLKKKIIYMLTLLPKSIQNKIIKLFWLKFFSICYRCQRHWWCNLNCEYLCEISKKNWNRPNSILRGLGETDLWK